jgi:ankyrin repeat protein
VLHADLKLSQNRQKWFKHFLDSDLNFNAQNKNGETPLLVWASSPQSLVEETDQLDCKGQEEVKDRFPE